MTAAVAVAIGCDNVVTDACLCIFFYHKREKEGLRSNVASYYLLPNRIATVAIEKEKKEEENLYFKKYRSSRSDSK